MAEFALAQSNRIAQPLPGRERFLRIHRALREQGCHSPTDMSLIKMIKALKMLCMYEKMKSTDLKVKRVSMEHLTRTLNGEFAKLDITGCGMEFSGWYTELLLFQFAGFITIERGSISIKDKFIKMSVDSRLADFEIYDNIQSELAKHNNQLRQEIVSRCERYRIVHLLLDLAYTDRDYVTEDESQSDQPFDSSFMIPLG
jgi:hypothetical protein